MQVWAKVKLKNEVQIKRQQRRAAVQPSGCLWQEAAQHFHTISTLNFGSFNSTVSFHLFPSPFPNWFKCYFCSIFCLIAVSCPGCLIFHAFIWRTLYANLEKWIPNIAHTCHCYCQTNLSLALETHSDSEISICHVNNFIYILLLLIF